MKHKSISFLLAILMSMAANMAMAYDAEIEGIYYNFNGTEATVTSGDNKYTGDIVIPETVMFNETEYSVASIGDYAFGYCEGLTSVTIGNSVTSIGEWAFSNCSNLASITIGNSVTSIGTYAFSNCTSLASITIPNSVTHIAAYAFYFCNSLTSITIPSSVTTIGDSAFGGCSDLTSIIVEEGNSRFDSRNSCNAIIVTSSNELAVGCKGTTIPGSVTRIGHHAFYCCRGLTSIMIPNSVKSIGWEAFNGCKGLTSITIPGSVTIIGDAAFGGCSGLTSIVVEEENTNYDSRNNCNAIIETSSNTLFAGCQNTTIPDGVTSIGYMAFYGCEGLISITIPNGVKSIEQCAFYGCSSLTDVKIPNSVTTIGYFAFMECCGLTSIIIPGSVASIGGFAFTDCSGLTSITIPNGVTSIGEWAFRSCSGLTSVTIPNSVMTIEWGAFDDCSSLTDVYCYAETVPTTGDNVFFNTPIDNAILHVPSGSIDAYKTTAPWSNFKEIVESDYLNVADLDIKAGDSNTQDISLDNSHTNLVAFQMDLTLPDGISIDKTGCSLSSRITDEDQELTIGKLESGAYRITSTSLSLTPISGNDGTLLSLKLTAEDGCIGGQATIKNIIFSTAESEKVVMRDKTFDISILYNLTYKVDGEEYNNYEVEYGTTITPEAEPTKEGYTFGGWSEIPETMPAYDVTVTGTFTINKYKLTYTVDGEEYKNYEVEYGAAIKPEAEPTKEGYTFSGWSEIPETMPAHDVTVTGTFTINKYKLTYTVDGEEYKNYEVEYGTTITPEAEPTKEGYTFSGWSEIPETMPAHDVTVTGTFGINTYKLTYMIDDAVYKVVDYKYGETITPEPAPEGNYASFEWVGLPETMPAKDVTVYANYVTGITDVVIKENIVRIYSPNGKILDKLQKGLNIVLMKDGTIKKIVVK